ncbi:MAG: PTS sugar transporter subunit IIA [Pseudomonadota bacterium]
MKLKPVEFAACLNVQQSTVERWIRQGKIPVRQSEGFCIFDEKALEKWAQKHNISLTLSDHHKNDTKNSEKNALTLAMKRGGVHYDIPGDSVNEVLKNAVSLVPDMSEYDREILYNKLIERENLTPTGIGKGVAIPHPRSPMTGTDTKAFISTCFLKNKIDFGAIDGKPVTVMFLIVCPSVKSHLYFLSRISFCLRDNSFINFLNSSPTPEIFYEKIDTFEKRLEKTDK